jgi:hypothetical protein
MARTIAASGIDIPQRTKLAMVVAMARSLDGRTSATSAPTPEAMIVDAIGRSCTAVTISRERMRDLDMLFIVSDHC